MLLRELLGNKGNFDKLSYLSYQRFSYRNDDSEGTLRTASPTSKTVIISHVFVGDAVLSIPMKKNVL